MTPLSRQEFDNALEKLIILNLNLKIRIIMKKRKEEINFINKFKCKISKYNRSNKYIYTMLHIIFLLQSSLFIILNSNWFFSTWYILFAQKSSRLAIGSVYYHRYKL